MPPSPPSDPPVSQPRASKGGGPAVGVPGIPRGPHASADDSEIEFQGTPASRATRRSEPWVPTVDGADGANASSSTRRFVSDASRPSGDTYERAAPVHDRPGEHGLGVPRQQATDARALSAAEARAIEDAEETAARAGAEAILADLERQQQTGFRLPSWLRGPISLGVVALAALVGLFVVGQVTTTIAGLSALPEWSRTVVLAALGIFGLLLAWVMLRLGITLAKLRRNRRVEVSALRALLERRSWQATALARERLDAAHKELSGWLRAYPLDAGTAGRARLEAAGLSPADVQELVRARNHLLAPELVGPPEAWLDELRDRFQSVLDRAADRRVRSQAWTVGVSTALAPYPVFDTAIVLTASFRLVDDLCQLYQLRAGGFDTVVVLGKVLGHAYLAGNLQDITASATDPIGEELASHLGSLGGKLAGKLLGKVGEGAINTVLIRRLGRTARRLLQPVGPPAATRG